MMTSIVFIVLVLTLSRVQRVRGDPLIQLPHPLYDEVAVDFSDNAIVQVDYIEHLPSMEWFMLDRNLLENFPDFANNTQIVGISLTKNRLSSVPASLLDPLINLTYLNVAANRLTGFPDPAGAVSLQQLTLAWNKLTQLPDWPRLGLRLLELDVSYNAMTSMAADRLARLQVLRSLRANNNQLTGPVPAINGMVNVIKVSLDANLLSELDVRVIGQLVGNVVVSLSGNRIARVTYVYSLYRLRQFNTVSVILFNNPVICDCRSRWLKEALFMGNPLIIGVTCRSPEDKAGADMDLLEMASLRCDETPIRELHAAKIEPSWLPPYDVIATPHARSAFGCIQLCYDREDCLLFGFRPSTRQCALTSVSVRGMPNASPWDGDEVTWLVMN